MRRLLMYATAVLLSGTLLSCKPPFLLKYASARRVVVTERHGKLQISGGTIHSGACVDTVRQERSGGTVTLVVRLMPANNRCSGEYFVMVDKRPDLKSIQLGIPGSSNPEELGTIWERRAKPTW